MYTRNADRRISRLCRRFGRGTGVIVPVHGVWVDLAGLHQELDGVKLSLGRRQMERRPAVIVHHIQVHVLEPGPIDKKME